MSQGPFIPILDLREEVDQLWPELSARLEHVLRSGQFILGPETEAFEREAAEFLGVKHAIGLNSGTDALMIGLRALGVEPGDEVITTPFSFFATAETISNVGAKPVFVDVELDSMNLDLEQVEGAITPRTKAILPVHLFGRPVEMPRLMEIARRHGLKVLEDCAQSFGSQVDGRQTGSIGDLGAFSFFPTKNLGCYGDGGLISTNDDSAAEISLKLRNHGSIERYRNEMLGYNSRLDSIHAAILRIKLPRVQEYNLRRREIATKYNTLLADVEGVQTPEVSPGHVFHQYTVRITQGNRDAVQARMRELGVGTMVYYPIPQDRLLVYRGQYPRYPNSDRLAEQVLSLPIWPQITDAQQERVAQALRQALQSG